MPPPGQTSSQQQKQTPSQELKTKNILKNYNGAIEDYNKSINLNPNIIAFNNRGISKNNVEDYYGAILDYNKAIEMDSSYADAYANRGVSKYYIENKKGACDDWSKAIELGFDNAKQWVIDQCNQLIKCNILEIIQTSNPYNVVVDATFKPPARIP